MKKAVFNRILLTALSAVFAGQTLEAGENQAIAPPSGATPTTGAFRQISSDVYSLGLVQLDKRKRTITFPGSVNMTNGPVEYALVHVSGKVHESVLKTEADPMHIHVAALLLGWTNSMAGQELKSNPDLTGPRLEIFVHWKSDGMERTVRLEEFITNTLTRARMIRGEWVYSGSRVVEGAFLAHRDGQIVAIIADQDALVNNPRPGRNDDEIWRPNSELAPPLSTPITVTIQRSLDPPPEQPVVR